MRISNSPYHTESNPNMKTSIISQSIHRLRLGCSFIALCAGWFFTAPAAHAGLQLDMHLYGSYFCFPWISTNSTPPSPPDTAYFVWSPSSTINNGIHFQLNPDNSISGSGSSFFPDYQTFIHEITNGNWTLLVTNAVSTNQYTFTVTVPSTLTSNLFAPVTITSPTSGQINVANTPAFTWTGPAGWAGALNVYDNTVDNNGNQTYFTSASLTPDQTSWPCPVALPNGTNNFSANYTSNATAIVIVSTPVDNLSNPFPGFSFISTLETDASQEFLVGAPAGPSTLGHTNVAHYTFDNSATPFQLGLDASPNGNDLGTYTYWGPVHTNSADVVAGGGAAQFFGTSSMDALDQVLTNLNAVLAGSFTFSTWVKTTVTNGFDYNNAFYGAVIFWAYNDQGNTNDTIPLSITGNKAAFTTRDHLGNFDTLHSTTSVNDGNYHLITVTRDQGTGEKKIYVDGQFDASEIGTTDPLNGNNYELNLGGKSYYIEVSSTVTNYSSYKGLLDDAQIYSGVLSAADVASLYANPGTTIPDVAGSGPNGPVAHYDFDEGTVLAADVSGNNNNIINAGNFGGSGPSISPDTAAGSGSVSFDGGSYLTASSNLLATLAGDFTVSLWLKTGQNFGSQYDPAWAGAGVITADSPNSGAKDLIPVALTGGQVAFNIGDGSFDSTLNSSATVNDDAWHHVVVTRNQSTGERQIFIDGMLDSSDFATTVLLDSPVLLTIGAKSDASDPNPSSPDYNGSNGYEGLLDDVQIYNRVLGSNEVAFLYSHPGAIIANSDFGAALNTANVTWTTEGDGNWFTETATSLDGLAAQSGAITNSQTSAIQTTAPADGQVSFHWKVSSEQDFDFLTFYINGVQQDTISGEVDWTQDTFDVSAGDVLRWEYSKDGSDSAGQDAGWLDQVVLPGATLAQYPVDVDLQFNISRSQDPNLGEIYGGGVSFNSVSPDPTTTNSVHSPHDYFITETYPGGGWGSGAILSSLDQAINEFTNGLWKIYINQGSPTQQVYSFQVSITGLDTNLLKAVKILSPTNGSVNVHANAPFYWTGPTNFSSLHLDLANVANYLSLPLTATNWASAPTLSNGSQFFDLNYSSNNFPGVTFSTPVDASSNPVRTWSTTVNLSSVAFSLFFVGPNPTQLTQPQLVGPNFQFAFLSQTGVTNSVQYRTNLVLGTWLTYSNVVGDGSLKTIPIPISVFNGARQGFVRISSQ